MYGVEVWGGAGEVLIGRLRRQQNRCIRLCSDITNNDVTFLYKENKLLAFDEIYKYYVSVRFFQYFKLNRNVFFTDMINDLKCSHRYGTRFATNEKLNMPYCRLAMCQRSFLYNAVHFWNDIPKTIRDSPSIYKFKARLRKFLL